LGNEVAQKLQVYPNPATSVISFILPDNAVATSVEVTDVRGLRVAGTRYADGQLNISTLAKGMYTLTVSDGQKVFHQRFVKE
jgi:bacillolysin